MYVYGIKLLVGNNMQLVSTYALMNFLLCQFPVSDAQSGHHAAQARTRLVESMSCGCERQRKNTIHVFIVLWLRTLMEISITQRAFKSEIK